MYVIGTAGHVDHGKTTLIKKYLERRKSNLDKPDPLNIKYYSFILPSTHTVLKPPLIL